MNKSLSLLDLSPSGRNSGTHVLSARLAGLITGWWLLGAASAELSTGKQDVSALRHIQISKDNRHFVVSGSNAEFRPWGFNYDHDRSNRLLEDYWTTEWDEVAGDFEEMKALGANTVRIHLQLGKFMNSSREPNKDSVHRLARLVGLAEKTGLYLDITGLGCTRRKTCPHGTTTLPKRSDGMFRLSFGRRLPGLAARAQRYSAMT
jgi:hypothetical protein